MSQALVLSGGGPVGVAWESGLIAGLAQGGVDLARADLILGTSAGAIAGARLAAGVSAANLADGFLAPPPDMPPPAGGPATFDFARLRRLIVEAQSGADRAAARRELGAMALAAETMDEAKALELFRSALGDLPVVGWPSAVFACVAVDALSGEVRIWDQAAGVDVLPAVASSCAVPGLYPPLSLAGGRYMDGGARSASNADLAAGHARVLVLSMQRPEAPGMALRVAEETERLRAAGAEVAVIAPDADALAAFTPSFLDFERDARVARLGLAQGRREAAALQAFWM